MNMSIKNGKNTKLMKSEHYLIDLEFDAFEELY